MHATLGPLKQNKRGHIHMIIAMLAPHTTVYPPIIPRSGYGEDITSRNNSTACVGYTALSDFTKGSNNKGRNTHGFIAPAKRKGNETNSTQCWTKYVLEDMAWYFNGFLQMARNKIAQYPATPQQYSLIYFSFLFLQEKGKSRQITKK
jgi:hypothetical protein